MPKKPALKFRDVQEAMDWATNPGSEKMQRHWNFTFALMRFNFSRPIRGAREAYLEGARLFEKAAAKASELAFELEAQYLRYREEVLPIEKVKIDELANDLLRQSQACHRWTLDGSVGAHIDSYLSIIPPLEDVNVDTAKIASETEALTGESNKTANRKRLSREDVLLVPQGKDVAFPPWWASDSSRMRIAALNLRRLSSKLQALANQVSQPGGGRPRDGDRFGLIEDARELGISIPALSYLMAAFAVEPPRPSITPIPRTILEMRGSGRPPGPLTKEERAWLTNSQENWFKRLNEAAKEGRKQRKKKQEAFRRWKSERQCQNDRP
jgi:hypothetical protein